MSQVVNVRKAELNKLGYRDLEDWLATSPNHVYVGRDMTRYVRGAVGSKWANPYKLSQYELGESIRLYEEHIRNTPALYNRILTELDGKVLGCWCHPQPCHAHALIKMLKELKRQDQQSKLN